MKRFKKKVLSQKLPVLCAVYLFISSYSHYSVAGEKNKVNPDTFSLPATLGNVIDKHNAQGDKLLIQIKDLHSNPDVQRNIARIIGFITKELQINNIYVEGYWGNYDIDSVRNHPADPSLKDAVLEYFTEKGKISGTEYFAFKENYPASVFGVEDKKIYEDNKTCLQNVLSDNKSAMNYLFNVKNKLDSTTKTDLNSTLYGFFEEYESFIWHKNTDFNSFAKTLAGYVKSVQITEDKYKLTLNFLKIVELENKIKPDLLEKEIKEFLAYCNGNAPHHELKLLTEKYFRYLVGKLNGDEFFVYCDEFAGKNKVNMDKFAQIKTKIEIAGLKRTINSTELFNELREVSYKIMENLAGSDYEIELCNYIDYATLLSRLVNLNLTHNEWDWYSVYSQKGMWDNLVSFMHSKHGVDVAPDKVRACIEQASAFYGLSRKRDGILCDNTLDNMDKNKVRAAIIVTGGFHTEEILKELKDRNVSYIAVTPATNSQLEAAMYPGVMTGYQEYLERILGIRNFQVSNLAPELIGSKLILDALTHLEGVKVSESFSKSYFNLLSALGKLDFEAGGTILDLFKSSTPLSSELIDKFISGKLNINDRAKVLEMVLMSAPSPYLDPRYLKKLRDNGYVQFTDAQIDEFAVVRTAINKIDRNNRKQYIENIKIKMEGLSTEEPRPTQRTYNKVESTLKNLNGRSIVYFSPEMKLIGGIRSLFWGGLGVLAGEYVEGLADTGATTYGVTLLYKSVVKQRLNENGIQITEELPVDYTKLPVFDTGVIIEQNVIGTPVRARVWEIPAGDARVFALEDLTSSITRMLYGGASETPQLRAEQDQLLGRGGIEALQKLLDKGIIDHVPAILHMNEANCIFVADELMQRQMFAGELDPNSYWKDVGLAFTTHTPVPAGLPKVVSQNFSTDNIMHLGWLLGIDHITLIKIYAQYAYGSTWANLTDGQRNQLLEMMRKDVDTLINEFKGFAGGSNIILNLTEAAANLADITSSVSLRHELVTNTEIINVKKSPSRHDRGVKVPSIGITNGVNLHDWQPPEYQMIDPDYIPDDTLIGVKKREKQEFINMVNKKSGSTLSADHLTISVMRRTNTYKRTDLILQDIDSLAESLKSEFGDMPINVVFSGISHPKDEPGKAMFKSIQEAVKRKHPTIHVAFVEQYDISVAKHGVRGSDIWLMMPVEKMEASSTSHQKALGSGTMIVSTFDGAMIEEVIDIDIDPSKSNGAFITPLILNREVNKSQLRFVNKDTEEGNGDGGFYSRPVIKINGGEEFVPVAVIERGDKFIIVDEIISDLSAQNLQRLKDNQPIHLKESNFDIGKSLAQDGKISREGLTSLIYQGLDPFTTHELMKLYLNNRKPWYSMLYKKINSIARVYYGAQTGNQEMKSQYVNLLRNSIKRSYEVDIRRMALEYIQLMYSQIVQANGTRSENHLSLLESLLPEKDLQEKVRQRREELLKYKKQEFDFGIGLRMMWGYMENNNVGTSLKSLNTSAAPLEGLHPAGEPLEINIDLKCGWVVQPEDFDVVLYYGQPGDLRSSVIMKLDKTVDFVGKIYRYSAVITPEMSGKYQFRTAIVPKNEKFAAFAELARKSETEPDSLATFNDEQKNQLKFANKAINEFLDDSLRKWSQDTVFVEIVPISGPKTLADLKNARAVAIVESSL